MTVCHVDVETISLVDLKKVGSFKYAADPSTKVIILCYAFDDGPVQTWLPQTQHEMPVQLINHFGNGGHCLAWNSHFEEAILKECLDIRAIFGCSMASAAYQSYPLALGQAADALGLPIGKDKIGNALMKRMCRPRIIHQDGTPEWWHETDPDKFLRLQAYCRMDVVLERMIHKKLSSGLPHDEALVWLVDKHMNEKGVRLDRELVKKLQNIVEVEQTRLDNRMSKITGGKVPRCSQVAKLKTWLQDYSADPIGSLDKDNLKAMIDGKKFWHESLEALKLRQEAAKSSTAKLSKMWDYASMNDDRMRGLIQYYGAMRTGRFAGRGPQPHNYPRPDIDKPENAIAYIKAGMTVQGVQAFWGSPMSVVSSCLRGCFIPAENHDFLSVDFSQIEARVLAWLTGQLDVLKVFTDGEDVYVHAAQKVGSTNRFLGKVLTLACGYGMGGPKFQDTAAKQGLDMSEHNAQEAVDKWRSVNSHIVSGWKVLETACINAATGNISGWQTAFNNKLQVSRIDGTLVITLPSGRQLFYQEPAMIAGRFNSAQLSYMGLNGYTRKWEQIETYGGKLIENVVQAIARDLLTHAMLKLQHAGFYGMVLTVHDELLLEIEKSSHQQRVDAAINIVTTGPDWAKGIPLACDWWRGDRYRK